VLPGHERRFGPLPVPPMQGELERLALRLRGT
jgi:hypothetical protein